MLCNHESSLHLLDKYIRKILNARGIRDNLDCPTQPETYKILAQLTTVSPLKLYYASAHKFGSVFGPITISGALKTLNLNGNILPQIPTHGIQGIINPPNHSQMCPKCLKTGKYHRSIWLSTAVSVCLTHKCLLVSSCTQCKTPITMDGITRDACTQCGYVLSDSPCISLENDDWGLKSQRSIQLWLQEPFRQLQDVHLPSGSPRVLFCFLHGIRHVLLRLNSHFPLLHTPPIEIEELASTASSIPHLEPFQNYVSITTGYQLLFDWPSKFYDFLDIYHTFTNPASMPVMMKNFRYFFPVWINKYWSHSDFSFVQSAFRTYCSERREYRKQGITNFRDAHGNILYVHQFEAAITLYCSGLSIYDLVTEGKLAPHMLQFDGRTIKVYKYADIMLLKASVGHTLSSEEIDQKAREFRDQYVTGRQAIAILGITRERLVNFINKGRVQPITGPLIDGRDMYLFHKKDLETLQGFIGAKSK
jgi:hypothetical protein